MSFHDFVENVAIYIVVEARLSSCLKPSLNSDNKHFMAYLAYV